MNPENTFFNSKEIYPENYFEPQTYEAKIKRENERLNLDGKMKHIVFSVHEQLRVRKLSPSLPRVKPKSTKAKNKLSAVPQNSTQSGKANDDVKCENRRNSPRTKHKHKEFCHKATETPSNYLSFAGQKRLMLAQQRNANLENMINEHRHLFEDRRSLAQDVFAVRHCLDDLQHRVKRSLQQLNNKKTFCECHGLLKNTNCEKCEDNN